MFTTKRFISVLTLAVLSMQFFSGVAFAFDLSEQCDNCDELLKIVREQSRNIKPEIKKVHEREKLLDRLFQKLFEVRGDLNYREILANSGATIGEECKPVFDIEDDENFSAMPFKIGKVMFCFESEEAYDQFAERFREHISDISSEVTSVLTEIRAEQAELKQGLDHTRELHDNLRNAREEAARCMDAIRDECPSMQNRVREFKRPERREFAEERPSGLMNKLEKLQEKTKRLLDSGKMSEEMLSMINDNLDQLMGYHFPEGASDELDSEIDEFISEVEDGDIDTRFGQFRSKVAHLKEKGRPEKFRLGMIPFEDVDDDAWYFEPVRFMKENGIAEGYEGGKKFNPNSRVTRAEVMKMALESSNMDLSESDDEDIFDDAKKHWGKKYINHAYKNGIVTGFKDGFRPDQPVTRAEALKMVGKVLGMSFPECKTSEFEDMNTHWAKCITQEAKDAGVVDGMPDGNFHPDEPITRAAFAKILKGVIEYLNDGGI